METNAERKAREERQRISRMKVASQYGSTYRPSGLHLGVKPATAYPPTMGGRRKSRRHHKSRHHKKRRHTSRRR